MRIVVTGAAGFIGSNIVRGLNARSIDDIIAVDDLTQGDKFRNLADLRIADLWTPTRSMSSSRKAHLAKWKPCSMKEHAATPWKLTAST